jgi:hypothetical protein
MEAGTTGARVEGSFGSKLQCDRPRDDCFVKKSDGNSCRITEVKGKLAANGGATMNFSCVDHKSDRSEDLRMFVSLRGGFSMRRLKERSLRDSIETMRDAMQCIEMTGRD